MPEPLPASHPIMKSIAKETAVVRDLENARSETDQLIRGLTEKREPKKDPMTDQEFIARCREAYGKRQLSSLSTAEWKRLEDLSGSRLASAKLPVLCDLAELRIALSEALAQLAARPRDGIGAAR